MKNSYDWCAEVVEYDHIVIDNGLKDNKIICEIIIDEEENSIRIYKGSMDAFDYVEVKL